MYLETLDVRSNDILIYSQNKFDFEENFKIIWKRDRIKKPRSINYFEVCNFIKSNVPKNLVVYRLLTNVSRINAYSTKYGYFIKIDDRMDIVYFDPVFALEDLKYLQFELNENQFRFKIQQLGLKSIHSIENEAAYSMEYCFDLRAQEAKNQDDKIFADAIFAFDDTYSDEFDIQMVGDEEKNHKSSKPEPEFNAEICEVNESTDKISLKKLEAPGSLDPFDVREQKMQLLKKALGLERPDEKSNKFMEIQETSSNVPKDEKIGGDSEIFDLFKSSQKKADIKHGIRNDSFLLRITKEQ